MDRSVLIGVVVVIVIVVAGFLAYNYIGKSTGASQLNTSSILTSTQQTTTIAQNSSAASNSLANYTFYSVEVSPHLQIPGTLNASSGNISDSTPLDTNVSVNYTISSPKGVAQGSPSGTIRFGPQAGVSNQLLGSFKTQNVGNLTIHINLTLANGALVIGGTSYKFYLLGNETFRTSEIGIDGAAMSSSNGRNLAISLNYTLVNSKVFINPNGATVCLYPTLINESGTYYLNFDEFNLVNYSSAASACG